MKGKTAEESHVISTNIVMPNETNIHNNLFGGELLARMDRVGAISARKHSEKEVVTASVNHVSFKTPIPLDSVVRIESKVSRAFKTSLEVYVDVWIEDTRTGESYKSNDGIYTFVAVNKSTQPQLVPQLIPETVLEKERFDSALRRKELSLILGDRMNPKDAVELRKLFL
jgi:acyl-CoA hydrolase